MASGPGAKQTAAEREVWRLLAGVADPEIPVLSIVDLGIVRYVRHGPDGRLHVGITPTYTGCPATAAIRGATNPLTSAAQAISAEPRYARKPLIVSLRLRNVKLNRGNNN